MCPKMNVLFSILLISIIPTIPILASTPPLNTHHPSHFLKPNPPKTNRPTPRPPQQYFELTQPLPTSALPPSCTLPLFHHTFKYTYGQPPITVPYSPPRHCSWSHATLEFSAFSKGNQYDRIAAVWLAGAELLRTSTAEPAEDGIFWKVQKDVTKYSSLLVQENLQLTVMLENLVNEVFTAAYEVNISFIYYANVENHKVDGFSLSELYDQPADLIIPVSGFEEEGFWFRIESEWDRKTKRVKIPRNSYKAVLELYISFHGNDEFWYKNYANSYIIANDLSTERRNGAYREVYVTIDGKFVGSVVPFPVIFTGGINPLFWEPVVGIGAFDLPTYDIDLTPFLSFLLDGERHSFGIGIVDGISFWLIDANLHLWLDPYSDEVQSGYFENKAMSFEIESAAEFDGLDGEFEVEIERTMEFSGWVNSSFGNFTTYINHELEFESNIKVRKDGNEEIIKQKVTDKIEVEVKSSYGRTISLSKLNQEYPLEIRTSTVKGANGMSTMTTSLENSYDGKTRSSTLKNNQTASGWMLVKGNEVLDGESNLIQEYSYEGDSGCYSRNVTTANGALLSDDTSLLCPSLVSSY